MAATGQRAHLLETRVTALADAVLALARGPEGLLTINQGSGLPTRAAACRRGRQAL